MQAQNAGQPVPPPFSITDFLSKAVLVYLAMNTIASFTQKNKGDKSAISRSDASQITAQSRQQKELASENLKSFGFTPDTYVAPTFPTVDDDGNPLTTHNCLFSQGHCFDLEVYISEYGQFDTQTPFLQVFIFLHIFCFRLYIHLCFF